MAAAEEEELATAALFLSYCGHGFKGMQRNPGASTIEGELEGALARVGAIDSTMGAKKLGWRRAARTDAGVSAAAQLVTGRLRAAALVDAAALVVQVNAQLPSAIRLLGVTRIASTFCAKLRCEARRYEYLLPAFALDPAAHRGRVDGGDARDGGFHMGDVQRRRFNEILGRFVGRHNFHNFSRHVQGGDAAAERTVYSFAADEAALRLQGCDFVRIVVVGRSFMLHQIRKMVGLAVAIMRGAAPSAIIDAALQRQADMVLPTAPQLGLLLDECMYSGDEVSFECYRDEIRELKSKLIYSHIASSSANVVARWLPSLNPRNYGAFSFP